MCTWTWIEFLISCVYFCHVQHFAREDFFENDEVGLYEWFMINCCTYNIVININILGYSEDQSDQHKAEEGHSVEHGEV